MWQTQKQNLGHRLPYMLSKVKDNEEKAQETTEKEKINTEELLKA